MTGVVIYNFIPSLSHTRNISVNFSAYEYIVIECQTCNDHKTGISFTLYFFNSCYPTAWFEIVVINIIVYYFVVAIILHYTHVIMLSYYTYSVSVGQ